MVQVGREEKLAGDAQAERPAAQWRDDEFPELRGGR